MAPLGQVWPLFLGAVLLLVLKCAHSQHVFVVAPNTFRLDAEETIAVFSHSGVQNVKVSLADCPGKKKVFFSQDLRVVDSQPQTVKVTVKTKDIPDLNITGPLDQHYVFLMVKGPNVDKEYKVLVTLHSGYLFIQTDKPIYNPTHTVNIRVMRLNEDMVADNEPFTLQIRNPQGTIVDSYPSEKLKSDRGMYNHRFQFPKHPLFGEWSIVVIYGVKVKQNTTVKFELKEYVLPTFEVEVKAPEVILPDTKVFQVSADAKYVYGRKVEGNATFQMKVKLETGHTQLIGSCDGKELKNGKATCDFNVGFIKNNTNIVWFPGIVGAKLQVEALVFEKASGFKENQTIDSTVFATAPHIVSFHRSLSDFKPGIDAAVQVQIRHVNGKPADRVRARIAVADHNNKPLEVEESTKISNEEGFMSFVIRTNINHKLLKVTVTTDDVTHPSKGTYTLFKYKTVINNTYIGIARTESEVFKVGHTRTLSVFTNTDTGAEIPLSFMVISKGRIIKTGSMLNMGRKQRSFDFQVTTDMVPSVRVVIFAAYRNELLTDSLKFRVEKKCQSGLKIIVDSDRGKPGDSVSFNIEGKTNSVVGVLAVDKAVYALRNKDKLTKDKMFDEMEKHDLGCGVGGGIDSAAVLANAGVIIIADKVSLTGERKSCEERKLRKRAIGDEISRNHGAPNRQCCEYGKKPDKLKRSCQARSDIIRRFTGEGLEDREGCAKVFFKCCQESFESSIVNEQPPGVYGRIVQVDVDDLPTSEVDLEEMLENVKPRDHFVETWLFTTHIIGPSGTKEFNHTLPDSITTWVIQAVGLSGPGGGMCVAEPKNVVAFKEIFLDVKLPYNVVKNEQIEIPVTIFNYGKDTVNIRVYTYGVQGLCSEAQPGEKSASKRISLSPNSAETTAFQVIPLEAGEFPLKFVAASGSGSDIVIKELNVIHEGVPCEEFFPFSIDPSNTEKRKRRNIVSEKYEAKFDVENKRQISIVKLQPELEFVVPGTEYGVIEAIGDKFGPTIHTSLDNPDELLRLPHGCGEQTIAHMAPTVYTLHYLKATGKLTADQEQKAYNAIRQGYSWELTFRKQDGSFCVWQHEPSSTWLTAFVAKVFCQAGNYIFVDENVVCGALNWLVSKQKPDGTFVEGYDLHHKEMKGGVNGAVPLTAFVAMTFQQCDCNNVNLEKPKEKAIAYLLNQTAIINDPYRMAIATYALALYDTELAKEPNEKLLRMSSYDPGLNARYWGDGKSGLSMEATSYALLIQVLYSDIDKATSIVNWMNTKRNIGGSFWSSQDTVIAIEALSEYAILARDPDISLVLNISSTTDPTFNQTWEFQPHNARVRRQTQLNKVGGRLIVEAQGSGVGLFGVRLRYNVANNLDQICRFDVNVTVSEAKEKIEEKNVAKPLDVNVRDGLFPEELAEDLGFELPQKNKVEGRPALDGQPVRFANRKQAIPVRLADIIGDNRDILFPDDVEDQPRFMWKRDLVAVINPPKQVIPNFKTLNLTICTRFLGYKDTDMAIVDVGMLTGYKARKSDLKDMVNDNSLPIDRFEVKGRNLIIYLEKISHTKRFCFSFRMDREYIASNLESGLVRVYDYYEPDQACSRFYRSEISGEVLKKVCFGNVCKCAQGNEIFLIRFLHCISCVVIHIVNVGLGGCPPKEPFVNVTSTTKIANKREKLASMACQDNTYFWKVKVDDKKVEDSGYIRYSMDVVRVLKESQEKKDEVQGEIREFLGRKNCETSNLMKGATYYIIGRDPEPREIDGVIRHVYFIDKLTKMKEWVDMSNAKNKLSPEQKLQTIFGYVERKFHNNQGCSD